MRNTPTYRPAFVTTRSFRFDAIPPYQAKSLLIIYDGSTLSRRRARRFLPRLVEHPSLVPFSLRRPDRPGRN